MTPKALEALAEKDLQASFDDFVRDQYIPFLNLNLNKAEQPLPYKEFYNPPGGHPRFIADKYYGDQGMHCTPVDTPAVAYTLEQHEHAFFIKLLEYVREPTKAIDTGTVNGLVKDLDLTDPNQTRPLGS